MKPIYKKWTAMIVAIAAVALFVVSPQVQLPKAKAESSATMAKAWGENLFDQLGIGDSSWQSHSTPVTMPGLTGVKQITANVYSGFAIMSDGSAKAWGSNTNGMLGIGNTTEQSIPVMIPGLTGVKQIICNESSTYALMNDGTVKAWGSNDYYQLGIGNTTNSTSPVTIPGLTGVKQIETGENSAYALMSDGSVKAWGYNQYGLGIGNSPYGISPETIPGLAGVKKIAVYMYSTYALMNDGSVKAWGYNNYGQLGIGNTTNQAAPVTIPGLAGVTQLSANGATFAVLNDGTVKGWGYNYYGQLGIGNNTNQLSPVTVSGLTGVNHIIGMYTDTYIIMNSGTVEACGSNAYGQIGNGSTFDQWMFTTVSGLTGTTQLVSDGNSTYCIMSDGTVKAWGYNQYGQLGIGSTTNQLTPTVIPGLTGVTQISDFSNAVFVVMTSDSTPPAITLSQSGWSKSSVNVSATITDTESGVAIQEWAVGNYTTPTAFLTAAGQNILTGSTFNVTTNGSYTVYAKDNAGNEAVQTIIVNHIDTTAPTFSSVSVTPSGITSGNVTINMTASDSGSGVASIQMPDNAIITNATVSYTVTENGTYWFTAKDAAGNTTPFAVGVSNIDRNVSITHPISVNYMIDPNTNKLTSPPLALTNNSKIPVKISVQSFQNVPDGNLTLHDAAPDKYSDWSKLSKAQTLSDIAMGLTVEEKAIGSSTWSQIDRPDTLYAANLTGKTLLGTLNAGGTGNLDLSALFGRAWDNSYSPKANIVFSFDLPD